MAEDKVESAEGGRRAITFGHKSTVTVSFSLAVLAICIGLKGWQVNIERDVRANTSVIETYRSNVDRLLAATEDLYRLREQFDAEQARSSGVGHWDRFCMDQWVQRADKDNPSLKLPDVSKTPWFDRERGVIVYP